MKLNLLSTMTSASRALLIATLALVSIAAPNVQGANFFDNTISTVNLGNASGGSTLGHKSWAIFALSGGVTITDSVADNSPGGYDVLGNVGLGNPGSLTMTNSWIKGGVYRSLGTQVVPPSGSGFYIGLPVTNATYVNQAVTDANNAAAAAAVLARVSAGLSVTGGVPASVLTNNTTAISLTGPGSISGASGQTYVLNLADLILSGATAALTLNGSSTTNYVINVNRFMTLSSGAKIVLGGGLTEANVLFNVKSFSTQYDVTLSGASEVHGIILAPTRTVRETGASKIIGEVIAKGVALSGASKVINPFVSN